MPAPKLTKAARTLLEKTFKRMRQMPDTFNMDEWIQHALDVEPSSTRPTPYCGTVACLAGHIALAATGRLPEQPPFYVVSRLSKKIQARLGPQVGIIASTAEVTFAALGLQEEIPYLLFYTSDWPNQFKIAYDIATTEPERVRVAIKRVRHWLRTGE